MIRCKQQTFEHSLSNKDRLRKIDKQWEKQKQLNKINYTFLLMNQSTQFVIKLSHVAWEKKVKCV